MRVNGHCCSSGGRGGGFGLGRRRAFVVTCKVAPVKKTVVIGLAADSGCGKSTFMRRLTSIFGGAATPPRGGNPDSNTLISDTTTVICLDDYHSLDRYGRKEKAVTALDPRANNFDLMYEQVKALKEGKSVEKPIYNHVSGLLDPPETILPPKILVIEGLHPMWVPASLILLAMVTIFLQSVHAESCWIFEPEKNCGICENVILCPYCAPKLARKTSNSCKVIAIEEIHHRIKTPATAILPSAGCGMIRWSHNAKRLQQLACRRRSEIYFQGLTVHHRGRVLQFTLLWYQVSAVVLLLCLLLLLRIC